MKKLLVSAILALVSISVALAQAPVFKYAKLLDGTWGENARSIKKSSDNKMLAFASFGSRANGDAVSYDGKEVGVGAGTTANSDNLNAILMKLDWDGSCLWSLYTERGDISLAQSDMAATSDGGAIVVMKLRYSNQSPIESPVIVDAKGTKTSLQNWNMGSLRTYYLVLAKVSSDGALEWTKTIDIDTSAEEAATSAAQKIATTNGVYANSLVVDEDDNIYLGGNYRKTLIFKNATNGTITITPHNTEGWDGDSQKSVGDLFLVKMDKDGNYLNHLTSKGVFSRNEIARMVYADGKLYLMGNIQAVANSAANNAAKLTLGGKTVTTYGTYDNILVACTDKDLNVQYAKAIIAYPASNSKHITQCKNIQLLDNCLYLMGHIVGGFGDNSSTEAAINGASTSHEGFIIKLNANDGAWMSATTNGQSIGGYYGVAKANGKTYVYGYKLGTVFQDEYSDESNWTKVATHNIITGGICTAWTQLYENGNVYSFTRMNNTLSFLNSEETVKPTSWGVAFTCFQLQTTTGISGVNTADNLSVEGLQGAIKVTATDETNVNILNTLGQQVYRKKINIGSTTISLPQGVYVVNNQKVLVK